jgi:hypothetical protein
VQDNSPLRRNVIYNAALALVCAGVFVSSYAFVFQSYFDHEDNEEYGFNLDDGARIILNNGTYELYNGEEFVFAFSSEENAMKMVEMGVPLEGDSK